MERASLNQNLFLAEKNQNESSSDKLLNMPPLINRVSGQSFSLENNTYSDTTIGKIEQELGLPPGYLEIRDNQKKQNDQLIRQTTKELSQREIEGPRWQIQRLDRKQIEIIKPQVIIKPTEVVKPALDGLKPVKIDIEKSNERYEELKKLERVINSLLGHKISEYDKSISDNLGCARAVSLALQRTYGLPFKDSNVIRLEKRIQEYGWEKIATKDRQAGDVIIAHRQPGDYNHSAIYIGDDLIFNNDSNDLMMRISSYDKFRSDEFRKVSVYRKRKN